MAKCKINNCWMDSIEKAGIGIASPKGGNIFIRKLDVDLISDEHWELVKRCAFHPEPEIDLTVEEMSQLLAAAKSSRGIVSMRRTVKNVAAPQVSSVASKTVPTTQKSFAQRKFERNKRIQNNTQKILGGCCPSCDKYALNVKRYTGWVGYYCKNCKGGGSITMKK